MNDEINIEILKDAANANPDNMETEPTANIEIDHAKVEPDYKVKFSESSKEANRLLEQNRIKDAEIERLRQLAESNQTGANHSNNSEQIIPGFDMMSEEEQKNLLAYTDGIRKTVRQEIYKDPAIAHSVHQYNEGVWNTSFEQIVSEYPELREHKDEFKSKYFRADNVPSNIKDILGDVAKVYLFDKARDIGAKKALEQADRIDTERVNGGDKIPAPTRTTEDWHRLSQENPVKFAEEYRKSQQK